MGIQHSSSFIFSWYCIAENFGECFNLVIWSIFRMSPNLKLPITCMPITLSIQITETFHQILMLAKVTCYTVYCSLIKIQPPTNAHAIKQALQLLTLHIPLHRGWSLCMWLCIWRILHHCWCWGRSPIGYHGDHSHHFGLWQTTLQKKENNTWWDNYKSQYNISSVIMTKETSATYSVHTYSVQLSGSSKFQQSIPAALFSITTETLCLIMFCIILHCSGCRTRRKD